MSAKHTPGPIRYDYEPGYCGELIARDGMTVAAFVNEPSEADARRLVACWNACDGYETETLETINLIESAYAAEVREFELTRQRDALLDALKAMVALDKEHHQRCQGDEDVCREVRQARAAIAKAEGGKK